MCTTVEVVDVAQVCWALRRGHPARVGRVVLRPDLLRDIIWLRDPAGEVQIASAAIDEAGCLAALQGAMRYCVDGPCGEGEPLRPSVRFR
ncbi:hypothetical protein LF41_1056 [Lysobacter dokdonensis DS-58]|uniref:Uncharacterized protein n=1 Tax=Lysobacter dokdonensis DS-58 TaxID=1300345 RepID=A0A0A2X5J4_9GAMM|nr:hypothetical protein [Lysobacter dokdonensis]KGQ20519.1 hypothetical protein LF41_1056 [Lysobacter dokdonensis DS-58]